MIFGRNTNGQASTAAVVEPQDVSSTPAQKPEPHITLGVIVDTGEPFRISLKGHAHIRGMTRSGKTSLTLIPVIYQLLEEE